MNSLATLSVNNSFKMSISIWAIFYIFIYNNLNVFLILYSNLGIIISSVLWFGTHVTNCTKNNNRHYSSPNEFSPIFWKTVWIQGNSIIYEIKVCIGITIWNSNDLIEGRHGYCGIHYCFRYGSIINVWSHPKVQVLSCLK